MSRFLRTFSNVRNFSRRLFDFLTLILDETRRTRVAVTALHAHLGLGQTGRLQLGERIQRIESLVATNNAIAKRTASGSAALNDFCDETSRLLLTQQAMLTQITLATKAAADTVDQSLPSIEVAAQEATRTLLASLANTTQAMERQAEVLRRLQETVAAQASILPSWFAEPDTSRRIRGILALMQPAALGNGRKRRYGRDFDGGYVMIEDLGAAARALSLGINDDVSWDLEMAEAGLEVFQYDHTIAQLPQDHKNFHFRAQRIGSTDSNGTVSLSKALNEVIEDGKTNVILKVDIEGDEWHALDATEPSLLAHCTQIVMEYHHLDRLVEDGFAGVAARVLAKFQADFFVCHVHGNNCGNLVNAANVVFPETLEVTYANRRLYKPAMEVEIFPQALDMPNQPGRADLFLGAFRF
jgi:hypothetical protein